MSVKDAIKYISDNKLDEMRTEFNAAITEKAVKRLEERKIEIAKNYLGQPKA